MGLDRKADILENREILKEGGNLERPGEPEMRTLRFRMASQVTAIKNDFAAVRGDFSGQLLDQSGLSCAIGTDNGVQFPLTHGKRQAIRCQQPVIALYQLLNDQNIIRRHELFLDCGRKLSMPLRANSTIRIRSGPNISCQYSPT